MAEQRDRRVLRRRTRGQEQTPLQRNRPNQPRRVAVLPIAIAVVIGGATIAVAAVAGGSSSRPPQRLGRKPAKRPNVNQPPSTHPSAVPARTVPPVHRVESGSSVHLRVKETIVRFTDPARTIVVGGHTAQRSFQAEVRYPTGAQGPFPLIVFGHGFNDTPDVYAALLDSWTKAGYIVVAPIFPLENSNAPGGPTREDLHNQPLDMALVILSLLTPQTPAQARVAGMTNLKHIAVSGQSDGGDTALAAAYGPPQYRAPAVDAAVILSGADDPLLGEFSMPANGPPLLAVQGTADTINPPSETHRFFDLAARPKYLLSLLGAGHQSPYTQPGPDLTMVEHVTLAFLDRYLKGNRTPLSRYVARGSGGQGSTLIASE